MNGCAVDDGVVDARGPLHEPGGAAGEVVHDLGQRQRQPVEVDHVQVGEAPRRQHAAVAVADERRGVAR